MEKNSCFLSRVISTEEYDGIYFCYVEVKDPRQFEEDLKRMRIAFCDAHAVTKVSSIDFPEPNSVATFYLNCDENEVLEDLFKKHENLQCPGFVELEECISGDFLAVNESEARIGDYKIRFIEETLAVFVGKYKHFHGEAESSAIIPSFILDNTPKTKTSSNNTNDYCFVCSTCGSENVSAKCWANPNNDEVIDYLSDEQSDNFCENCGKHTTLTEQNQSVASSD